MKTVPSVIIQAVEQERWMPVQLSEIEKAEMEEAYEFALKFYKEWMRINDPKEKYCHNVLWIRDQYEKMLTEFGDYLNFEDSFGKWISAHIDAINKKQVLSDAEMDDAEICLTEMKIIRAVGSLVNLIHQIERNNEQEATTHV